MGDKHYELTNHLGNVMTTISDKKIFELISSPPLTYTWKPEVLSWQDYYPFGMQMPERSFSSEMYRFGFGGQEKDDEIAGHGNSYTAEFWQYDSRLGRRWNIDPIVKPHESSFSTFANNPIWFIDTNGADTIKNPNGEKMNVGTGYRTEERDGQHYLEGEDLKTKIWDQNALGPSGEFTGNYKDYETGQSNSFLDLIWRNPYNPLSGVDIYGSATIKFTGQRENSKFVVPYGGQIGYSSDEGSYVQSITHNNSYLSFGNQYFEGRFMPLQSNVSTGDYVSTRALVTLFRKGPVRFQGDVTTTNVFQNAQPGIRMVASWDFKLGSFASLSPEVVVGARVQVKKSFIPPMGPGLLLPRVLWYKF